MKSERGAIMGGFALVSLIWGSTWLVIKIGLESMSPLFAVAFRFTLAALVLVVIARMKKEHLPLDRASLQSYLAMGVLTYSFPFALVYWGEEYIASGLASILFAIYPFIVAIGSHFFVKTERLTLFKVIGIIFGFFGIVVIFWHDIHLGSATTMGISAILLSTLMQGASLIIIKRTTHHLSPIAMTLGGMIIGVVILYVMAFWFESVSALRFDMKGIGSIIYLGTLGSVVSFVTYYWLLKRVEVVYLSLVTLVTPVLAVILGALLLHETLAPQIFSGSAMICAGIIVANGKDFLRVLSNRKEEPIEEFESEG